MSVLIKLMNTPKQAGTYHALIRVYEEGHPTISVTEDNITTTYDMIPVPTPHGRLIDADELTKHMRSYYPSIDHLCRSQHVVTKGDIDNAPTIIEAEASE